MSSRISSHIHPYEHTHAALLLCPGGLRLGLPSRSPAGRPVSCTWHRVSLCAGRRPPAPGPAHTPSVLTHLKVTPGQTRPSVHNTQDWGPRLLPRLDKDIKFIVIRAELSLFLVTQPPLTGGGLELHTRTVPSSQLRPHPAPSSQGSPQPHTGPPRRAPTPSKGRLWEPSAHTPAIRFHAPIPPRHAHTVRSPTGRHTSWEAHAGPIPAHLGLLWAQPGNFLPLSTCAGQTAAAPLALPAPCIHHRSPVLVKGGRRALRW